MKKGEAQTCYGEKNANITVSCDGCPNSYSGKDIIWHCPETISELHPNGYDLCDKCAQRQINFDELRGLKGIKRDSKYPIRVTLLYYKTTNNGIINEPMINDIIQKLVKSESLGRVAAPPQPAPTTTQSPVAQPTAQIQPITQQPIQPIIQQQPIYSAPIQPIPQKPRVIIPKVKVNPADYKVISGAIKELKLSDEYVKIFQNENVTDKDLKLLKDNDLETLLPTLGPRMRFRAWLKENAGKLQGGNTGVNKTDYQQISNIFRTLNVVNAQKYVTNFMNFGINDKALGYLLGNDKDLEILIPDMSARVLFKGYLIKQQQPKPIPIQQRAPIQQMSGSSLQATPQTMGGNSGFLF